MSVLRRTVSTAAAAAIASVKHWSRADRRRVITVNGAAIDVLCWVLLARGNLIICRMGELLAGGV